MSTVEYSGAVRPSNGGDQLFQDMKFFLAAHIPQRSQYRDKIASRGGIVVRTEDQDVHIIVDHLKKARVTQPDAISYRFIDDCIRSGTLLAIDEFRVHDAVMPRRAGDMSRRGRSAKMPFTKEEDVFLWDTMTAYISQGGTKQGRRSFEEIEQQCPRHTWQSWRERWIKHLMDKPRPVPLTGDRPADTGVPGSRATREPEATRASAAEALPQTLPRALPELPAEALPGILLDAEAHDNGTQDAAEVTAADTQDQVPESTEDDGQPMSLGETGELVVSDADKGKLVMHARHIFALDPEQEDSAWSSFAALPDHRHHSKDQWKHIWNQTMLPLLDDAWESRKENVDTSQTVGQGDNDEGHEEPSQAQANEASRDRAERSPAQANSKRRRETLQTSQSQSQSQSQTTSSQSDTANLLARDRRRDPSGTSLLSYEGTPERRSKRMRLAEVEPENDSEEMQIQTQSYQAVEQDSHENGGDLEVEAITDGEATIFSSAKNQHSSVPATTQEETNNTLTNQNSTQSQIDAQALEGMDRIEYDDDNEKEDENDDHEEGDEVEEGSVSGQTIPDSESLGNSPRPQESPTSSQPLAEIAEDAEDAKEGEAAETSLNEQDGQIEDTEDVSALYFDEETQNLGVQCGNEHETAQHTDQPQRHAHFNSTADSEFDSSNIPTTAPGNTAHSVPLSSGPSQRNLQPQPGPSSSRSDCIRTTQPGFTSQLQASSSAAHDGADAGDERHKTSLIDSQEEYSSSVTPSIYEEYEEEENEDDTQAAAAAAHTTEHQGDEYGREHDNEDDEENDTDNQTQHQHQHHQQQQQQQEPAAPSSPAPAISNIANSPNSSFSSNDDQLETWFQTRLSAGYLQTDIADALHAASLQIDLAEEALIYLQQTGELPHGTRGIWTKGDDADLTVLSLGPEGEENNDTTDDGNTSDERERKRRRRERRRQRRRRLLDKHGEAYVRMRVEFLEL